MSKTKAGGSSKNGRDSNAKRLGPKVFDGQTGNALHSVGPVRKTVCQRLWYMVPAKVIPWVAKLKTD